MRVYGNCGTMPHTGSRPTPTLTGIKHPPKATALGADLMKPPGHIAHLNKQAQKRRGRPKTEAAPKTCEQCGATFTRRDNEANNSYNLRATCSPECATAYRITKQKAAAKQQPPCHCGKPYYAKGLCENHYKKQRKAAA